MQLNSILPIDRLVWFYGISTFVDCLRPNKFLRNLSDLFQTIPFGMITQFNY